MKSETMTKIWGGGASEEVGKDLSDIMTVEDAQIDSMLLDYEIVSLLAYQLQLRKEFVISTEDSNAILSGLLRLLGNKITIDPAIEDVHGFVEGYLKGSGGIAYKNLRIFLSRNEQSHIDIKSFYIDHLLKISQYLTTLSETMTTRKEDFKGVMPGYTHNRQAMPIMISTYFDYFSRIFLDMSLDTLDLSEKFTVFSPLGYGSGFGSLSPIDFNAVAESLGFKSSAKNPMAGSFYRGIDDLDVSTLLLRIMIFLSKISQDFIMFSAGNVAFITLPDGFSTGSSLMPNKRNPDFLEMVQGYASEAIGHFVSTATILMNKGSGYHREFQASKDKTIEFVILCEKILYHFQDFFLEFRLNEKKAMDSMENSVNATAEAFSIFQSGKSWKDSYAMVGEKIRKDMPLDYHKPPEFTSVGGQEILYAKEKRLKLFNSWHAPREDVLLRAKDIITNKSLDERILQD
ncbi:MAG: lyase family protein [Thermoplasmataceae archaeon]